MLGGNCFIELKLYVPAGLSEYAKAMSTKNISTIKWKNTLITLWEPYIFQPNIMFEQKRKRNSLYFKISCLNCQEIVQKIVLKKSLAHWYKVIQFWFEFYTNFII